MVPKEIFNRAADELWLRGQHGKKGGQHFGSRSALKGRTFCRCGESMRRLRRLEPVFVCKACSAEVTETDLKGQILAAISRLPQHHDQIRQIISSLCLASPDRLERASARRREWALLNLLPAGVPKYTPSCSTEADFRARTAKRTTEWDDNTIIRILERVVPGESVTFKGGVTINITE